MDRVTCRIAGCATGAKMATRELCWTHYQRWRRTGDVGPLGPITAPDIWTRIDRSGGPEACWPWLGGLSGQGYGHIARPNETKEGYAHRYIFEKTHGTIPKDMTVDHRCANTLCCNPAHLQLLTLRQNIQRRKPSMKRAGYRLQRCPHRVDGILPDEFLYVSPNGSRYCRVCQSKRYVEWQRERRQNARSRQVSCLNTGQV